MTSIKWYIFAALFIIYSAVLFYLGGLKSRDTLDHSLAAQSATVAAALLAQRKISDAEEARLNAVIAHYEATPIDPIALTVGSRVYKYAAASCPTVSSTSAAATGAINTAPVPSGPGPVEQATNDAFTACAKDSAELAAIQSAWPR